MIAEKTLFSYTGIKLSIAGSKYLISPEACPKVTIESVYLMLDELKNTVIDS